MWPATVAIAWSLFAFGGLYTWTLFPLIAVVALGLTMARPAAFRTRKTLDFFLLLVILSVAAQLIPLADSIRAVLSPRADVVVRALTVGTTSGAAGWRPLSIRPDATLISVVCLAVMFGVFLIARSTFERGRLGSSVRAIGVIGLIAAVAALVQLAATNHLIYGFWEPAEANARPFGPFVNRNHMATWLILAMPMTCGYVITHVRARTMDLADRRLALARALDSTTIWQLGCGVMMVSALFMTLSRSGVVGLLAAIAAGFTIAYLKLGRLSVGWLLGAGAFLLAAATYLANFDALATRFARTLELGTERAEIWRQTIPIVKDFALTGTGAGTFNRAMLVYQEGDRQFLFNQAHNHYLQIAAEGGVLVSVPALCAAALLIGLVVRQLVRDSTSIFWARAGAAASLIAVGVQSFWDTGLCMPANGVLLAVCAALAVHDVETVRQERREG